jgi:hypothetical protein
LQARKERKKGRKKRRKRRAQISRPGLEIFMAAVASRVGDGVHMMIMQEQQQQQLPRIHQHQRFQNHPLPQKKTQL